MSPNTFSISSALCLFLAIGPATVLSAPQLNGLPLLGGPSNTDPAPTTGDSEHDAGAGIAAGIPGGPGVVLGAGEHSEHHGPCGPGVNYEHDAGSGIAAGIPGGPGVVLGAGTHDQHNAYPCPEPVVVATPVPPVVVPETTAPVVVVPQPSVPVVPVPSAPATTWVPPIWTTTPIVIPSSPVIVAPSPPPAAYSTPLIHSPAPSATPPVIPAYNAGSSLAPSSFLALALPLVLGLIY